MRQNPFGEVSLLCSKWVAQICVLCLLFAKAHPDKACTGLVATLTISSTNDHLTAQVCLEEDESIYWIDWKGKRCLDLMRNGYCPPNFVETPDACLFVTLPRSNPWERPFNLTSASETQPFTSEVSYWASVMRIKRYGQYASMDLVNNGSKVEQNRIPQDGDFYNKNCAIINYKTEKIFPEYCNRSYPQVFIFPKSYVKGFCPGEYSSAKGFGSRTCYCGRDSDNEDDSDCEGMARVRNNVDLCTVGSILKRFMPLSNKSIDVSVSMVTVKKLEPKMALSFDQHSEELILVVYNPNELFHYNEYHGKLPTCYIDTVSDKDDAIVPTDLLFESNSHEKFQVYKLHQKDFPNFYYCMSTKVEDMQNILSNRVLACKNKYGNEYSLHLAISGMDKLYRIDQYFIPPQLYRIFDKNQTALRVMEIINFNEFELEYVLHVTSFFDRDVEEEYNTFRVALTNLPGYIRPMSFYSSEFCLPTKSANLSWPLTNISDVVVPKELCVQKNGLPVTRLCGGNFLMGARWLGVIGKCDAEPTTISIYMHSIANDNITEEGLKNVSSLIEEGIGLLDVYYINRIMRKVPKNRVYYRLVAKLANEFLNVNSSILRQAQEHMNATDEILINMDNVDYEFDTSVNELPTFLYNDTNLLIYITKPFVSNVSGIVLYQKPNLERGVGYITRNSSLEQYLKSDDLILATFIPEEVLATMDQDITFTIMIYFNDKLFVTDPSIAAKPSGPVVSVSVTNFGVYLPGTLPVIYQHNTSNNASECAFWDYGKRTGRKKGNWSRVGGFYKLYPKRSGFHICYFNHLTHFSLLLLDEQSIPANESQVISDGYALEALNVFADILTLVGLTGIFVTAIMFDRWRSKSGTKILLNMSVALGAEVITSQLSEVVSSCSVIGPLIHYFVMSKFCWMFVYAVLQYMRFVKVFGPVPVNIVIKSSLFGWGFPLLPVCLTLAVDYSSYDFISHLCGPTEYSLYFGLMLPIGLITFVNFAVFFVVLKKVCSKIVERHSKVKDSYQLQVQLATLLFFILGIPTFILLVSNIITNRILKETVIYICSFTSNVQGFILFLFYVVFNKETRMGWKNIYVKRTNSSTLTTSSSK